MASVIINKPLFGLTVGTLLTQTITATSNRWIAANGTWFDDTYVSTHPDTFLPPLVSGVTWFVANADGTTGTITGIANVTGVKPNYFALLASAQAAATAAAALMLNFKT